MALWLQSGQSVAHGTGGRRRLRVDDAIVMLENITRHIEDGVEPKLAALQGTREIGFTIVSISLSLIAVLIPILLMGGIIGRLFREFAVT